MRLKLSGDASRDLTRLYRQSMLNFGRAHADRYLSRLDAALQRVADMPEASPERPDLNGARVCPIEAHHILYRIKADTVLILRVLHGRQKLSLYLKN